VEAILLDARGPAARQMAAALEEYRGLNAVHVIAHGAPGRVRFAAGEWSAETLEDEAGDLAAIGEALGTDRDLLLWSCNAGEGTRGRALVDALSRVTGAPVRAATHLVGAAAIGGRWELNTLSHRGSTVRPPLTDVGVAQYAGLCAVGPIGAEGVSVAVEIAVTGTLPIGNTSKNVTYFIIDNTKKAIVGHVVLPDAAEKNTSVALTVKVPSDSGSLTIGNFDDAGNFQASTLLHVNNPAGGHRPTGAVRR
jgi:hypothetical protein